MNAAPQETKQDGTAEKSFATTAPSLSLPKGGGAIKGIGEKFAANPVTGTGSMSIPLPVSPGRSGFGPQLTLSYDSGAGNGPFGLGWNLSLPSITRKTDKGLPQYHDAEESDVYLLSGAEDLVPVLVEEQGKWVREKLPDCQVNGLSFRVDRYRPRIEGLFARIECWSNLADRTDVRWRSISKDNVATWYGVDAASRIADPSDLSHIFSWQICRTHDDKGNVMVYDYVADDSQGVDPAQAHERNRTPLMRSTQHYLRSIRYGNRTPHFPNYEATAPATPLPTNQDWMFSVIFDYGEGRYQPDATAESELSLIHATVDPKVPQSGWPVRSDPFSSYRASFEVRTYRLCRRVLMFHHFPAELHTAACLVRATEFKHQEEPVGSFITSVIQSGYVRLDDIDPLQTGDAYRMRSLPPVEFEYTKAEISSEIHDVDSASLENLPVGLDGSAYQWVDLDGEGLTGILAEQNGSWYYKRNLSALPQLTTDGSPETRAHFSPIECVSTLPALATGGRHQFLDLAGDGNIDVVNFNGPTPGFYERTSDGGWAPFSPFRSLPNVAWDDPNQRFIDLTGDGHADILITEDNVFTYHASLAEDGFDQAEKVYQSFDDETGPRLLVADATVSIAVADMSGDGLADLVRIRNGEVCYWPNLGYGRFGAKVTLDNSPWFDRPDQFDPKRLRLADIDGSGTTDLIYLGRNRIAIYRNLAGNRLADAEPLDHFPPVDNHTAVQVCDLLGNGTACLVWSSPLSGDSQRPMHYIDLMGGQKPHLLVKTRNNLGAETIVQYAPSTKFYLADKFAGKPWITKLPFPVHCVEKTTVTDKWRKTTFASTYSYHHGYFDGLEREFRGFGRVEQIDTEDYRTFAADNLDSAHITQDQTLYQAPVKTITWYHTGAALDRRQILGQFATEYFPARYPQQNGVPEKTLPEPELDPGLNAEEWREALRACKGMVLRQESYELDVDALHAEVSAEVPVRLFSAATHNCYIRCLQPQNENLHAVFLVTESEALSYHYELDLRAAPPLTADPRIAHTLNLRHDEYGNPQQSVVVAYGRLAPGQYTGLPRPDLIAEVQAELHIAYNEMRYTQDIVLPEPIAGQSKPIKHHRLRLPCETLTCELKGIPKTGVVYYSLADFKKLDLSEKYGHETLITVPPPVLVARKEYHEHADGSAPQKRIVEHTRTLYFKDEDAISRPVAPHDFGQHGPRGFKFEDYKLALTDTLLDAVFQQRHPQTGALLDDKLAWEIDPGISVRAKLAEPVSINSPHLKSGYIRGTGIDASLTSQYWMRSGTAGFASEAARHFYLPEEYTDPFNNVTRLRYDLLDLFVQSTRDALGNTAGVDAFDYRVLAPIELKDANDNFSAVAFDILGLPVASAVMGKNISTDPTVEIWEGDDLKDFDLGMCNPPSGAIQAFSSPGVFDANRANQARSWLGRATARFVYHFGEERNATGVVTNWARQMAGACAITREIHAPGPGGMAATLPIQVALECSDGTGNVLMKKVQAEPDPESTATNPPLRWIVNGLTVLNNKGKPVKQYEPAFSDNFGPEFPQANGVTPVMYYDAAGRLVRTELPDGTLSRVEFSPWHMKTYDANDTVLESQWYRDHGAPLPADSEPPDPEKRSAWLAIRHADTPSLTILDSLGREVIAITHNRTPDINGVWQNTYVPTFTKLDAEGKPLWIRDARGNLVMQYITPTKPTRLVDQANEDIPSFTDPVTSELIYSAPCYDIAGNLLFQHSMDAGNRWTINDAAGKPMAAWDFNERQNLTTQLDERRLYSTEYDALHRPTALWLRRFDRPTPTSGAPLAQAYTAHAREKVERFEYRDGLPGDFANLNGQLIRHYDSSGIVETVRRDFKGNIREVHRQLVADATVSLVDWQSDLNADGTSKLSAETFTQVTEYDALNRMTRLFNWHLGEGSRVVVYKPAYGERGNLFSEDLVTRAKKVVRADGRDDYDEVADAPPPNPTQGTRTATAIQAIHYNAKGQKTFLQLGNGTITRYTYDEKTFRLTHLYTKRTPSGPNDRRFDDDCASNTADDPRPQRPCGLQNLHYAYDPFGNVTHIHDDAQQTIFFDGAVVEPSNDYVYDALYRLISAKGRETAQGGDAARDGEDTVYEPNFPITGQTVRNYTETYAYDSVGNFVTFEHAIQGDTANSWTRNYTTQPDSNRLSRTWTGTKDWDHTPVDKRTEYPHDTHGNMLNLANTAPRFHLRWDHRDMIRNIDFGGGGQAYYQYDSGKQRTRKIIARNPPDVPSHTIKEERIYLGGYELYRRYIGDPGDPIEEIESHHLMEGGQRVLLVEDVTTSGGPAHPRPDSLPFPAQTLFRYQYGNHLGSAGLELDDQAGVISYEEYHPNGTSAYYALNGAIEAPPKRYRYTGMERDEESGLNYHGARYYVPWLQRWTAFDPAQLIDGFNGYVYSRNNPVLRVDPGGMASSPSICELTTTPSRPQPKPRPPALVRQADFGEVEITARPPPKAKPGPALDSGSLPGNGKLLLDQKPTLNDGVVLDRGEGLGQTRYPWMSSKIPKLPPEEREQWYKAALEPYEAQLRESAARHHVPVQLLAAVILNELADIDYRDVVQENIKIANGSVGVAQIQVETAIKDNLIPGVTDAPGDPTENEYRYTVSRALKIPQVSIDAASKEIHLVLEAAAKNPEGPWQRTFDYPFFMTRPPDDVQKYYDFVRGGDQGRREVNLAQMIAAGYNSPAIMKTNDITTFTNAIPHGINAGKIAEDLFNFGLFRAQ